MEKEGGKKWKSRKISRFLFGIFVMKTVGGH